MGTIAYLSILPLQFDLSFYQDPNMGTVVGVTERNSAPYLSDAKTLSW